MKTDGKSFTEKSSHQNLLEKALEQQKEYLRKIIECFIDIFIQSYCKVDGNYNL
jgi:hypothetical protein